MYSNKISEMTRGWFVGDFEPSVYKTTDVESAIRVLEKGYKENPHFHKALTKVLVVLSGKVKMFKQYWCTDDIVVMEPGDITSIEAIEDSRVLMLNLPGIKNDKVYVESEDDKSINYGYTVYESKDVKNLLNIMIEMMGITSYSDNVNICENKTEKDYINMQKKTYENENVTPEDIVGQYDWHEEYPYETFLLYKNGDIRKPLLDDIGNKTALDFACGPGRMVKRMKKIFKKVDGCDISARLIEEARHRVPDADFYVTNGNDLGDVPLNNYDYIYCTISMQHIASYQIRKSILENMKKALKDGGKIVLQMAYNTSFPYVKEKSTYVVNNKQLVIREKDSLADYFGNDFDAQKTNGLHDVGIGENDIEAIKQDFSELFSNVSCWFSNVNNYYKNLNGRKHSEYWATDWIYIYAEK